MISADRLGVFAEAAALKHKIQPKNIKVFLIIFIDIVICL
jgi:hypothetical protein